MSFLGVSINCTSHNVPQFSASGIKICDHFILTHCSIVWRILSDCASKNASLLFVDKDFKSLQSILTQVIIEINPKFSVVLPVHYEKLNSSSLQDDVTFQVVKNDSNLSFEKLSALTIEAFLEEIIIFPSLFWEFLDLLYPNNQWKFDKSEGKKIYDDNSLENIFLSTFVILRIKGGGNICACFGNFEDLTSLPNKGTTIFIDGCPFGFDSARTVFLNSLSKGIISNVSQSGAIILTDARCILGCEGAPAYSLDDSFLVCGIVLSPFCWFKGEWVGFTFMAAIHPLLAYIRKTLDEPSSFLEVYPIAGCLPEPILLSNHSGSMLTLDDETHSCNPSSVIKEARLSRDVVNVMNKSIVRIKRNGSDEWGTGVIVAGNKGLVVSCAHVTRGSVDKVVQVVFWDGSERAGVVIFESKPLAAMEQRSGSRQQDNDFVMWDLAVVRLPIQPRHSLPLSSQIPSIGTPVLVGGHPLFRTEALSSPTFSLGNLASINWAFRKSCLIPRDEQQQYLSKSLIPRKDSKIPSAAASFSPVVMEGLICPQWRHCSLSDDAIPLVLQTTCAVYNGVSGGPVAALHPSKGAVVIGIVSCCVKDVKTKVCFPHVNLATPVFLLAEAIDRFNRTEDLTVFDSLSLAPSDAKGLKFNSVSKSKL